MDIYKRRRIAFRNHRICSPLSEASLDELCQAIPLAPGTKVLDIGCARGELLLRLARAYQIQGLGIDLVEEFLESARIQAERQNVQPLLEFRTQDASEFQSPMESWDLAICMGAGAAFGGPDGMIQHLANWVRPGGLILVDLGYWKQTPAVEYLQLLGAEEELYGTHSDNLERGRRLGLLPIYSRVSSQQEWDHFEGLYMQAVERYCVENPSDPDASELQSFIRRWNRAYHQWGRATLGYGLYLFLKPLAASS